MNKNYDTYTYEDVAEFLKISVRGVYRLVETKELCSIKVGGLNRVRAVDLDTFFERQISKNGVLS